MADPTGTLLPRTPELTGDSRLAVAGYLARYSGTTRTGYQLSLELYFRWALAVGLEPLHDVRRPHLELFVRYLEDERGNTPATVNSHLTPLIGLFKFAVIDGYLERDPAAYLRRPKVYIDESRTLGLDRVELQSLVGAAKASQHPQDGALIALLGLLGLRISEAIKVRIEDFSDVDRGYRILRLVGKGRRPASIPLPVAVARLLDAAAGERASGVLLQRRTMHRATDGLPYTRKTADIALQRLCKRAGIAKRITPHGQRHARIQTRRNERVAERITSSRRRSRAQHDRLGAPGRLVRIPRPRPGGGVLVGDVAAFSPDARPPWLHASVAVQLRHALAVMRGVPREGRWDGHGVLLVMMILMGSAPARARQQVTSSRGHAHERAGRADEVRVLR